MERIRMSHVMADMIVIACFVAVGAFAISKVGSENRAVETETEMVVAKTAIATTTEHSTVPSGDTSFKSYMDYRTITDTRSPQYRLQNDCWTDENGLRRCGDDYVIAVGTYYADMIGERLDIVLEDGNEFTAVVGDFKADCHTDESNRYTAMNNGGKNVIEFVVDVHELPRNARKMGDISYIDGFEGNVISIEEESKGADKV